MLLNICMLDLIGVLHVPAFRSTDVFPPLPHPLAAEADTQKIPSKPVASHVDPLNILLQLEGSGKWPDDPIGIAKTKSAFCLEIARRYFNSCRSSSK
jgi:U3 small nucleolar RNA-associated protein 22